MQNKIKKAKESLDASKSKVKEELEKFEIAKRRKINFDNGDAFNFHRLSSPEEAQQLEVDAAEKVDAARSEVEAGAKISHGSGRRRLRLAGPTDEPRSGRGVDATR